MPMALLLLLPPLPQRWPPLLALPPLLAHRRSPNHDQPTRRS
jgi:hypothetical protein